MEKSVNRELVKQVLIEWSKAADYLLHQSLKVEKEAIGQLATLFDYEIVIIDQWSWWDNYVRIVDKLTDEKK